VACMEGWNVTVGRERVDRGPVGNRVLASHPNFSQRGTPAFVRWRALVDPCYALADRLLCSAPPLPRIPVTRHAPPCTHGALTTGTGPRPPNE